MSEGERLVFVCAYLSAYPSLEASSKGMDRGAHSQFSFTGTKAKFDSNMRVRFGL